MPRSFSKKRKRKYHGNQHKLQMFVQGNQKNSTSIDVSASASGKK